MNMGFDSNLEKPAIESLKNILQKNIQVTDLQDLGKIPLSGHYTPDAYLSLKIGDEEIFLIVEVKAHVDNYHQIKRFFEVSESFDGLSFLIATSISNSIKEKLSEHGIGFLELDKELYFPLRLTQGLNSSTNLNNSLRKTGFRTETALKLLFYLETSLEARRFSQRKLAEDLGMSLGAVNTNLSLLETLGFIQRSSKKEIQMTNSKDAFEFWTHSYRNGPRNKLLIGRFSPIDAKFFSDWNHLKLGHSYWGGEPAVAKLRTYLTPGFFSLYTYESRLPILLRDLRLKKDPHGKIEILQAFWPEFLNQSDLSTVPVFLILCDLVGSGIDRNKEAAVELVTSNQSLRSYL